MNPKKTARKRKFTRIVLGDVVEIKVRCGLAYAQYVNYHRQRPVLGELVRVLPGIYKCRPKDFGNLVAGKERFYAFYPVGPAVTRHLVRIVAHQAIPERCRKFPVFKDCNENYETGDKTWYLWDGKKEWRLGRMSAKVRDYPIAEVISHGVLVERIETGWSPADEV